MMMSLFPIQNLATASAAPVNPAVQINSVWDFVLKGGPVMIPIGICSLIALAVMIERVVSLRRRAIIPPHFLGGLRKALQSGTERAEALEYCRKHASPLARVIGAGVRRLGEPVEAMERHVQEAGEREALRLRKNLRVLSVVASVSPLLGLLGTIFGMITAFQTVAASGEALGKTELLATGIYEAMITTAAGLCVAIPALVAYHWLAAKIDGLVMRIDHLAMEFIEDHGLASAGSMVAPAPVSHHNGQTAAAAEPARIGAPAASE